MASKSCKLHPGFKSHLRTIVGRVHVGMSDEKMREYVLSRLNKKAPQCIRTAVAKYATKVHHENLKLYLQVQRGIY